MLETCLLALLTLTIVLYLQARAAAREIRQSRSDITVIRSPRRGWPERHRIGRDKAATDRPDEEPARPAGTRRSESAVRPSGRHLCGQGAGRAGNARTRAY